MLKVFLAGIPVLGGIVATPFLINTTLGAKGVEIEGDRGKFHLSRQWKDCVALLNERLRGNNAQQIYLCKLDGKDNLEFIYYDSQSKEVNKITSLRQSSQGTWGHSQKLILNLESKVEKILDWPSESLLFDYTGTGRDDAENLLVPEKECTVSLKQGSNNTYTFSCEKNRVWTVIKREFNLL